MLDFLTLEDGTERLTRNVGLKSRIKCVLDDWQVKLENSFSFHFISFNRLTPNDPHMGRTAPLTSKRFILYIYSTNIGSEYFKHALYSPFFVS